MSIITFSILIAVILLVLYIKYKKKIFRYLRSPLYYCWVLLLVSNLGYAHYIQIGLRIIAILFSWTIIIVQRKGKVSLTVTKGAQIVLANIIVCLMSAAWSVSPAQTLFKSVELLTVLAVLCCIYRQEMDKSVFTIKILDVMMITLVILIAITFVGFFAVPSYFANTGYSASVSYLGRRIGEGILGANSSSALAAIVIAWIILLKYKRHIIIYLTLALCLGVMIFAQSRASLALIPIILFLRFFRPNQKYMFLYLIIIVCLIGFAVSKIDVIFAYLLRGQNSHEIASFSGREMMWSYAFNYIRERPFLGYGFGAGGEMVGKILPGLFNGMQHMHNGIIEQLLGTGIVGLLMLLLQPTLVLVYAVSNTIKQGLRGNLFDWFLIAFYLIRSLTSLGFASWLSPEIMLWFMYIVVLKNGRSIQNTYNKSACERRIRS